MELERIANINLIYQNMQDEESKDIFEARLFMHYDDRREFWNKVKRDKKWFFHGFNDKEYVVFGVGTMGQYISDILLTCGKRTVVYVDNNSIFYEKKVNGIRVISPQEYVSDFADVKIVMCSRKYQDSMIRQLMDLGVNKEKIIREENVCAFYGIQYFDVFKPQKNEIFVDAGAFDMGTTSDFIEWCNNDYEQIYVFEPDKSNIQKCRKWIYDKNDERIQLIDKGTYDFEGSVSFNSTGDGGAAITDKAGDTIDVTTIDNIVDGKRVSYIKMDVEGSELETLKGAEKTIRKYKPRLAVCVYHKPLDIIELPIYILQLNPDYKFYMRHYASNYCETVLYAY